MDRIGVVRTEWLTQIADAIESAQRLAWQLRTQEGASTQARELYNQLEAARTELQTISRGRGRSSMPEPDWLRSLGWTGGLTRDED